MTPSGEIERPKSSILRHVVGYLPPRNATATHILLVLDQFPKVLGGGERIALRTAGLLQEAGFRVSLLTFAIHPECAALASTPPPCPLYLLPLTKTYDLAACKAALQLGRFLRAEKVRIVQTFFESSDLWAGVVTKIFSSAALIWSRRDMGILRGRKHQIAYRLLARLPDRVFAVSERVRRHAIEVDRIPADRVLTIHNGLDLEAWPAREIHSSPSSGFTVVSLGNIRPVKGHDVLVEAAALVLRRLPETTFRVIGEILDDAFFQQLETRLGELGIADRFHFVGGLTDPAPLLLVADVFVLPSRSEGFSNAILEAMAASLPVVATSVGGNAEAVEQGRSGFIVPPEDASALAAAILQLLQSPVLLGRMSRASRSRLEAVFTSQAMLGKILACYRELLTQ